MNPFVSVAWLAEHLHDSNLAILDATMPPVGVTPPVDTHAKYTDMHIPGAVFFSIDHFSDHTSGLPHTLPGSEEFASKMGELGLSDSMTFVIYEQGNVFSAPRAWWMLRSYGVKNVFLLDGNLPAWLAAGHPTEMGDQRLPHATFHAHLDNTRVKTFADMQQKIAEHAQICDARSAGRFTGAAPEPRASLSSGHMPGATSTPFTDLADGASMKSPEALHEYFTAKNVNLQAPITTSCGSGVTAAVVLLGLELAGAADVTLYDGSWAEYASRPEAVIEKD